MGSHPHAKRRDTQVIKHRLHIPPHRWTDCILLQAAEKHYLIDVLRQPSDAVIEIFDGSDRTATAALHQENNQWSLRLIESRQDPDPASSVCLGVALLKGKKYDEVIKQATEVGISSFQPFLSERSVPKPEKKGLENKEVRWRALAAEAARQSCRTSIPTIESLKTFQAVLKQDQSPYKAILHAGITKATLHNWLDGLAPPRHTTLLVGPEGGFSPAEIEQACNAGFEPVGLELPILRAQTAAVVAAAFICCRK